MQGHRGVEHDAYHLSDGDIGSKVHCLDRVGGWIVCVDIWVLCLSDLILFGGRAVLGVDVIVVSGPIFLLEFMVSSHFPQNMS